jgi:hypothetical protein
VRRLATSRMPFGTKRLRICQNVAVAMPMLVAAEHAHRLHQMQVLPRAGHRPEREAALLVDLLAAADCHAKGMQRAMTLSRNTASHSWPLAEWIVDSTR